MTKDFSRPIFRPLSYYRFNATTQQEFKILASVIARQLYRRSNLLVGGGDCHAQNARSDMAE